MKPKKEKTKLMRGHTQNISVNEKCGNNFKCKGHIFEFIEIGIIQCTECGYKTEV